MADTAEEFADWLAREGRAANTVAAYRRDVTAYLRWSATTAGELADYVELVRATRARSSADRAVVALRMFHRWRDESAPTPELIGLPKAVPVEERELSEDEITQLLAATTGDTAERRRDAVAVALLYFGGLKATEAISLDLADVAGDAAVITVDRDGPHERILPVVPGLHDALTRWLVGRAGRVRLQPVAASVLLNRRGQRLTRQGLWLLTSAVGRRAGLRDGLAPNDLRRACAAHLGTRGLPQPAVSAFLGHSRGQLPSSGILNELGWGSCNLAL